MRMSPCQECPYRKPTCHDYCREYLDWHDELVAFKKARAFDKIMDAIDAKIIWRETRVKR